MVLQCGYLQFIIKHFWETANIIYVLYTFLFATTILWIWKKTGCYMYACYVSWSKTNIDLFSRLLYTTFFKQLHGNQAESYCWTSAYVLATRERDLSLLQLFLRFHSSLHVCLNSPIPITHYFPGKIWMQRDSSPHPGSITPYFLLLPLQSNW